jgi:mono/diheme cytochrome c family protein
MAWPSHLFAVPRPLLAAALALAALSAASARAPETPPPAERTATAQEAAFFEKQVRPVLQANCLNCHGGAKVRGGLRLTSRAEILAGGDRGPAVSLDRPDDSLLLRAVNHAGELHMPPKGKLAQPQIDTLAAWVRMGLPFPAGKPVAAAHAPPAVDERARSFWSFRPVSRPAVPAVKGAGWVRNPVDAFVLAKLEAAGLRPAPPADKGALLRRVHYAVTGLPPSPAEVDAFLADDAPDAYEKVVDRLLASRHYGEHWGRHWLDLVRFAETNSFERDADKPNAWKYRDYVIRAFNEDKPYDRFVREQLAGDELEPAAPEGLVATGYYRLGLWDDEPADPELSYYDQLDDIVATTGQTFLGLTVNCARCHDHKIDPVPQKDYYRLLAFVHGVRGYDYGEGAQRPLAPRAEAEKNREAVSAYEKKAMELAGGLKKVEDALAPKLAGGERDDFKYPHNRLAIVRKHAGTLVPREDAERYGSLRGQLDALNRDRPPALDKALAVVELPRPRDTFVLLRGNPHARGEKVEPGFPSVLTDAAPALPAPPAGAPSCGRRKVLADWVASPTNPLTARVMVNRVWQYNFGRGIVRSPSNFGYQGTPPTHPELLDWLASEFIAGGMRIKPLQRLLLTSNAFRMANRGDPAAAARDPENDLLWRFDPRRLSAEEVRDSVLAACGNLNLQKAEGRSVYPPLPAEVHAGQSMPGHGWGKSAPREAASRSVFVFVKRSLAVPILAAFDAPDPDLPCPARFTTTQPTQALAMINSAFLNDQAKVFADSVAHEAGPDPAARVRLALWRVAQRAPTSAEVERGVRFLASMEQEEGLAGPEALRRFCILALNLNEFVYLD